MPTAQAPESAGSAPRHYTNGDVPDAVTGRVPQNAQSSGNAGTCEDFEEIVLDYPGQENEYIGLEINLPDLQMTQQFLEMLRTASLEDTGMVVMFRPGSA